MGDDLPGKLPGTTRRSSCWPARQRHEVDVAIRPLSVYDQLIPHDQARLELTHLFRAMKAPAAARALPALAERAREEAWSYERFAEALLWDRGVRP